MQRLNKGKESISQKIQKITQSRREIKTDPVQPISSYRRTTQNDYSTNSSHFNQSNSLLNKTNLYSGSSLKDYTSGIKRGNNAIEETKKYQYSNNYRVVDKDEKPTNTRDIDHKKWGIRTRQAEATPLLPFNDREGTKYISQTSSNPTSKYSSNYNNNTKNNIYISGSSQSNNVAINQSKYLRSYGTDNSDKVTTSSNTSSLLNTNNLLRSPLLRQNYSSQKSATSISSLSSLSNNPIKSNAITIHSIVDTKKEPTKPIILNERKNEVIKIEKRSKLRSGNEPTTNTKNHSIVVTRNAKDDASSYGSKYNTNITNTGIYSINESHKNPKKEVVVNPRKNEVIQSTRSHKRNYYSTEPNKNVSYNINLRNQSNIYESKYNKNKNDTKSNISDYSKININNYVPKYSKYNVIEPKTKINEPITSKYNVSSTSSITSKYTVNEPKTYKYKINETITSKYNTNSNKYNISDNKYNVSDNKYNVNKYNLNDNKISTGYSSYVRKPIEPSYNRNTNEQKSYKYESSKYSIKETRPSYESKLTTTTSVKPSYEIKSKYLVNIPKPSYEVKSIKSTIETKPSYQPKSIYSYNQTKIDDNKTSNIIDNKDTTDKTNTDNNYSKYKKVEIKKETVIKETTSNVDNDKSPVQPESQTENKSYVGRFQFKNLLNKNNNESDNIPYKSTRLVETKEVKTTTTENVKETEEKKPEEENINKEVEEMKIKVENDLENEEKENEKVVEEKEQKVEKTVEKEVVEEQIVQQENEKQ